ncbi:MAG: hypothetical protein ACLTCP_02725 [Ruminococcus bicirculans (ex Wegman et al. 2014)]
MKRSSDSRLVIDENGECSLWGGEATVQRLCFLDFVPQALQKKAEV